MLHLAGLKSPAESLNQAFDYWGVNVAGTLNLIEAMRRHGCRRLVFSSSASVYGPALPFPAQGSDEETVSTGYAGADGLLGIYTTRRGTPDGPDAKAMLKDLAEGYF